jgi:hypothetical protein
VRALQRLDADNRDAGRVSGSAMIRAAPLAQLVEDLALTVL